MYCPYCGTKNPDDAEFCFNCGRSLAGVEQGDYGNDGGSAEQIDDRPRPSNHLVLAIIVTILCCRTLGIISIIFAVLTDDAWHKGNVDKAYSYSSWAKYLSYIGIAIGILMILFVLAFCLFVGTDMELPEWLGGIGNELQSC